MSIIYDFSRKVWVYLLRSKDPPFETFKTWKILVENQIGKKVKKLRTNNSLEYYSGQFDQLCKNKGI